MAWYYLPVASSKVVFAERTGVVTVTVDGGVCKVVAVVSAKTTTTKKQ